MFIQDCWQKVRLGDGDYKETLSTVFNPWDTCKPGKSDQREYYPTDSV